jgi:hypothetical protein
MNIFVCFLLSWFLHLYNLVLYATVSIVMCRVLLVTIMTGSSSDDWILLTLHLQVVLITLNYNAIALLHTFSSPLHMH